MKNLLLKFLRKGGVILAVVVYWILDDLIVFLPDSAVSAIGKWIFTLMGNAYRFDEFESFWGKAPEEE